MRAVGEKLTLIAKKKSGYLYYNMKRIIYIFLFFPLISFSVELHPEEECEQLRYTLMTNTSDLVSVVNDDIFTQVYSLQTISLLIDSDINTFRSSGDAWVDSNPRLADAYYNCADSYGINLARSIASNSYSTVETSFVDANNKLSSLRSTINGINCSECSVSNTNCCDFSDIIDWLDRIAGEVNEIHYNTSAINQLMTAYYQRFSDRLSLIDSAIRNGFLGVTNLLWTLDVDIDNGFDGVTNLLTRQISLLTGNNLALVCGFGNTTNLLQSIYDVGSVGWGVSTNLSNILYIPGNDDYWQYSSSQVLTTLSYPSYLSGNFSHFIDSLGFFNNADWEYSAFSYGLAPTYFLALQEIIGGMYAQNAWTQYQHDYMYPPITNSLTQIHIETTNFFSFFRGEIGVQGVLADWTPQQGAYYDFLTNHYLAIMRGDTLSANMSTKTNWFSRIETLLAALVFPDSQSTNVVDSSAYSDQQQAINSAISSVNSSAANSYHDFETSANSVISLYQMFAQNFDDVALPSRIVLFTLTNDDSSTEIVDFSLSDNPALTAFVEGTRAVTTFCWASVGIFLLFKFMVWALRGIYLTILFVYKVISSVLH